MVPFLPFELRFPREWDFWELKKHKEEFHLYRAGVLRTGPISETTDGEGDEVVSPSLPSPSPPRLPVRPVAICTKRHRHLGLPFRPPL